MRILFFCWSSVEGVAEPAYLVGNICIQLEADLRAERVRVDALAVELEQARAALRVAHVHCDRLAGNGEAADRSTTCFSRVVGDVADKLEAGVSTLELRPALELMLNWKGMVDFRTFNKVFGTVK